MAHTEPAPGRGVVVRPTNSLAIMSDGEINRSWRLAEALAASRAFPDPEKGEMTPQLAFATMLIGHDLGLSPTQALMGIDIVKGRPFIRSTMLAAFIRKNGLDYSIDEHDVEHCKITFYGPEGDERGVSEFTIEEAKQQGLVKKTRSGADGMWEKVPKNMLFARTISNGAKWFCPEVLGGIPVYTEADVIEADTIAGDGEPSGIDLGPKVEAVIQRAAELGHAGLADRGAAEMALGKRSPEYIQAWVDTATRELDELVATKEAEDAAKLEEGAVETTGRKVEDE